MLILKIIITCSSVLSYILTNLRSHIYKRGGKAMSYKIRTNYTLKEELKHQKEIGTVGDSSKSRRHLITTSTYNKNLYLNKKQFGSLVPLEK